MKKIVLFLFFTTLFYGCASYKFQRGKAPYDSGYVASRDNVTLIEYTLGAEQSVPDLAVAKERFKRRRNMVEHYYKQIGTIENRFKMAFVDPMVSFGKLFLGVFRLPAIAIADYRYEHNQKYREKVRALEQEQDLKEEARIEKIRKKLTDYIAKDLEKEGVVLRPVVESKADSMQEALGAIEKDQAQTQAMKDFISEVKPVSVPAPAVQETVAPSVQETAAPPKKSIPKKKAAVRPKPVVRAAKEIVGEPVALIRISPQKGFAPLVVSFSASGSHSPHGRIIAYEWDFGDGDTSHKVRCKNTYYSPSFEPVSYNVRLTVTDIKGNTASAQAVVEVLNK